MSTAEPRHDSQPPLFDITGEPVDLEGAPRLRDEHIRPQSARRHPMTHDLSALPRMSAQVSRSTSARPSQGGLD